MTAPATRDTLQKRCVARLSGLHEVYAAVTMDGGSVCRWCGETSPWPPVYAHRTSGAEWMGPVGDGTRRSPARVSVGRGES